MNAGRQWCGWEQPLPISKMERRADESSDGCRRGLQVGCSSWQGKCKSHTCVSRLSEGKSAVKGKRQQMALRGATRTLVSSLSQKSSFLECTACSGGCSAAQLLLATRCSALLIFSPFCSTASDTRIFFWQGVRLCHFVWPGLLQILNSQFKVGAYFCISRCAGTSSSGGELAAARNDLR